MNAFVPKAEWLNFDGKRTDEMMRLTELWMIVGKKRFDKRRFCWKRSGNLNEKDVYFPLRGVVICGSRLI